MTENLPATVADEYGTGLEDLDPNEVQIPRIKINHPAAVFEDGITGEEFPVLNGVFLGMVKQRTMWPKEVQNDTRPMCKSNDAVTGYPNMDSANSDDHFPWNEAPGLNPAAMERDKFGRVTIPCAACPFAQWTGTKQKPKPPRCSEVHTYPVMYSSEENGPIDRAGIVSFKGSGIKPSKAFLKGFAAAKRAVYTSYASVSLRPEERGMVKYAVPVFTKGGAVPEEEWAGYGEELKALREFLREPPRPNTDENGQPIQVVPGSAGAMPAPAQPVVPQPRTSPEVQPGGSIINQAATVPTTPTVEEEELPF